MNTQKKAVRYADFSTADIGDLLMETIVTLRTFAEEAGYSLSGHFPNREAFDAPLSESSYSMNKRLLKLHFRLKRKLSMRAANLFLHFIAAKLLAYDADLKIPRIDFSEQESAIKASRVAWVKARAEAEAKRLAYVEEKGDYYKR